MKFGKRFFGILLVSATLIQNSKQQTKLDFTAATFIRKIQGRDDNGATDCYGGGMFQSGPSFCLTFFNFRLENTTDLRREGGMRDQVICSTTTSQCAEIDSEELFIYKSENSGARIVVERKFSAMHPTNNVENINFNSGSWIEGSDSIALSYDYGFILYELSRSEEYRYYNHTTKGGYFTYFMKQTKYLIFKMNTEEFGYFFDLTSWEMAAGVKFSGETSINSDIYFLVPEFRRDKHLVYLQANVVSSTLKIYDMTNNNAIISSVVFSSEGKSLEEYPESMYFLITLDENIQVYELSESNSLELRFSGGSTVKLYNAFWNSKVNEMWIAAETEVFYLSIVSTNFCHGACTSCTKPFTPLIGGGCTACKSDKPSNGITCSNSIPDPAMGKVVGKLTFGGTLTQGTTVVMNKTLTPKSTSTSTTTTTTTTSSSSSSSGSSSTGMIVLIMMCCGPVIGFCIYKAINSNKKKKDSSSQLKKSTTKIMPLDNPNPGITPVSQIDPMMMNPAHQPQGKPLYRPPVPQQKPRFNSTFRQMNPSPMNSGFQPMGNPANMNYPPSQRPAPNLIPPPYMPQPRF